MTSCSFTCYNRKVALCVCVIVVTLCDTCLHTERSVSTATCLHPAARLDETVFLSQYIQGLPRLIGLNHPLVNYIGENVQFHLQYIDHTYVTHILLCCTSYATGSVHLVAG